MGFLKRLFGKRTQYLTDEEFTAINEHYDRYVGETTNVFHEIVSDRVHIDVNIIPEVPGRDFKVLYATGMSALPMPGLPRESQYAELFVVLPKDWPIEGDPLEDERNFWVIRMLKTMSRIPTDYGKGIYPGISMPNSDPDQPFPGTGFYGMMLGTPGIFDPMFEQLNVGEKTINFYPLLPMTKPEVDWKMVQPSATALLERLNDLKLDPLEVTLVNPNRSSFF